MIKKIFATSDQHFFLSKKFEEHQYVCARFYDQLESEKPDLVVMAGDLFDSKLRLGPEQIDAARNFIKNITNYCPVIIILGNHDLNLQAKDRADSLSPILHSLYAEIVHPIHFLKHSDIYTLYGIDWAVWSCLDDQKSPFEVAEPSGNYIFGLYHGTVKGCISESGFTLTSGIDVSEFEKCNRVILGDIHQQQSFRNNEIVYCGSFIQTKINENPSGSFIQWDWDGKNYNATPKRLENIYSTIVVNVDENLDLSKLTTLSHNQTIVLRYNSDEVSKEKLIETKKAVEKKFENTVTLAKAPKKKVKIENIVEAEETGTIDLKGYLAEYVQKNLAALKISESEISKVVALDESYSINLDISTDFEPGDFELPLIVLNNFLSFPPEDTRITDFGKDGIIGVNAPNRTGKSNLLRSIQFALYNYAPNNVPLKKLINKHNRDKESYVELYPVKNGHRYYIKRTLIPTKKGVSISLVFLEIDGEGNEIRKLTGEKRQETEKEIQKLFGIESMFEILSVFSAQKKQQAEFIECKNAERLTLVNRFMGLHSFEQKEKEVDSKLKTDRAVYKALQKEFDLKESLTDLEEDLTRFHELYDTRLPLKKKYEQDLADLIDENKELLALFEETKVAAAKRVTSPEETKAKLDTLTAKIKELDESISTNGDLLTLETAKLEKLKKHFFDITDGEDIKEYKPNHKAAKEYEDELAILVSEERKLNKQLTIDTCTNCGKEFSAADKKKVEVTLKEITTKKAELSETIKGIESELAVVVKYQDEYNRIGRLMSNLQTRILEDKNKMDRLVNDKSLVKDEVGDYEAVQKAKKVLSKLEPQVLAYQEEKKKIEGDSINLNYELKELERDIKQQEVEIVQFKKKSAELAEMESAIRILEAYKAVIHKDGLPIYILKSKMKAVNEQINLIISQIFEFEIIFSIDEDAGALDVDFIYPDDIENNDVSLASGAETFIINICIKVGLSQVSELPKMNTLMIDEGYGTLDKEALEKIPALFGVLSDSYKNVITISHLDEIKEMCQHQIKLEKVGKYTRIVE